MVRISGEKVLYVLRQGDGIILHKPRRDARYVYELLDWVVSVQVLRASRSGQVDFQGVEAC